MKAITKGFANQVFDVYVRLKFGVWEFYEFTISLYHCALVLCVVSTR